jgi:hypothetical protein
MLDGVCPTAVVEAGEFSAIGLHISLRFSQFSRSVGFANCIRLNY